MVGPDAEPNNNCSFISILLIISCIYISWIYLKKTSAQINLRDNKEWGAAEWLVEWAGGQTLSLTLWLVSSGPAAAESQSRL